MTDISANDRSVPASGGSTISTMDAPPTTPLAGGNDDAPTRESYEMIKRQLAQQTNEMAGLRFKAEAYDTTKRDFLSATQQEAIEYVKQMPDRVAPANAEYVAVLQKWAEGLPHTPAEKLEDQMPLAVLVDCASAGAKRAREAESVAAEKDEALKLALKGGEEKDVELHKVRKERDEMKELAEERQAQAEELALRYAQITGAARRNDFSLPASRERQPSAPVADGAPGSMASGLSASERASVAPPMGGVANTLDVASGKKPMRAAVAAGHFAGSGLLDMLKGNVGSGRVMRASTQHVLLGGSSDGGASSSGADTDLAATIRAAAMQH